MTPMAWDLAQTVLVVWGLATLFIFFLIWFRE